MYQVSVGRGGFRVSYPTTTSIAPYYRDYAFVASPFPLILSIEDHCSVVQQSAMAQILRLGESSSPKISSELNRCHLKINLFQGPIGSYAIG